MLKTVQNILLVLFGLLILIPVTVVVTTTIKTTQDFYLNPIALPTSVTFENYIAIFLENKLHLNFINSVIVTSSTVVLCLFLASMIAYVVMRVPGKKSFFIYSFFILGMMLPAQVNMVPLFGVVYKLGLTNSLFGLILVSTTTFMSVAVFIVGGFMKTLPKEMIEASSMDGASEWQIYTKIALPLSAPSLATTAIFLVVMVWNDLLYPLLFLTSNSIKTLPLALLDFQGEYFTNYPMIFSGVMIASLPVVIAYIFLQRYFIAGMTAGAMKG